MSVEEWRPIPGVAGYEVSDRGSVRSRRRAVPRMIRPWATRDGYQVVSLFPSGGARKNLRVHRLVALAFIGPRPIDHEVRHLDGDPANNLVQNLAYGTHSDNERDKVRHGKNPVAARTHCGQGHEYTPENTQWERYDHGQFRRCVTCRRARRQAA